MYRDLTESIYWHSVAQVIVGHQVKNDMLPFTFKIFFTFCEFTVRTQSIEGEALHDKVQEHTITLYSTL